jgi:hypothetical protein
MGIHSALTTPNGGPIRQLINRLENENLNPTRANGLQPGHDVSKAYQGYTLLSSLIGGAILVDMDGNLVRRWSVNAFPARMLPGGSIVGGQGSGKPGYGDASSIVQLDWCGTTVEWRWDGMPPGQPQPPGGARVHHDWQREGMPGGYWSPHAKPVVNGYEAKNWLLVHREPDPDLTSGVSDFPLEDDAIIEVDEGGNIVWTWNAWEHFDQMGFDEVAKEAIRTNKVSSFGGAGGGPGGIPESDWQHFNAASTLGPNKWYDHGDDRFHPDNIIWDGRSTNIIAIIARHDDRRGRWSSGDIVWRTGPSYGDGFPENQVGQIIGQHTAHMIPKGLPGAGNVLVFDNGGIAGFGSLLPGLTPYWPVAFRNYSRALEFNPVTHEKVWEYTNETDQRGSGGDRKFYSWFISSVQRLPNGNTLIDEGHDGRIFEVTRDGEIVWEYYQYPGYVYRAHRYPSSYLPVNQTCP